MSETNRTAEQIQFIALLEPLTGDDEHDLKVVRAMRDYARTTRDNYRLREFVEWCEFGQKRLFAVLDKLDKELKP